MPEETLAEIAGFVFFVRRRTLEPEAFEEELQNALLNVELRELSQAEATHLEEEFAEYEQRFPQE